MNWNDLHSRSERLAVDAELASRSGKIELAERLYKEAAAAETAALDAIEKDKSRTRGITAVSVVALWYKGRDFSAAEKIAHQCLAEGSFPAFAQTQLRNLLQMVWTASAAERVGIRFVPGDVLVSVSGGQVIHGGAPLGVILQRVESIQAILFRTVEMLLNRPFRRRGGPEGDIQSMFRPWLLQAPAGSYQFAVRIQEPEQKELWETDRPKVENVTSTFFRVLRATATDPEAELPTVVQSAEYRGAFLALSRNLAPASKTFDRLEVRDASSPAEIPVTFATETRQGLNASLRRLRPSPTLGEVEEPTTVRGVLRALHLDRDWLEVATADRPPEHVRIEEAGDALDDVVGPMVNRKVLVSAVRRGHKLLYRDIELDE